LIFGELTLQESEENCIILRFIACNLHHIGEVKEYNMGWSCSTCGEMRNTQFWMEILNESDISEVVGIGGRIILKLMLNGWTMWTGLTL
jgi:hypothetical protein